MGKTILGIDPGYAIVGWGVVHVTGNTYVCLGYGAIETPKQEEMATRLAMIDAELLKVIDRFKPNDIAIEELFFAKNTKTALAVAQARGIILLRAAHHSGRIFEYKPNQVKQAITGVGSADKKQMQFMVQRILGLKEVPKPDDAADALAVAITHGAQKEFRAT